MDQTTDYSIAQKVIHWLMALLIMLDLFVAQKFGNIMQEFDRLESRADHGSLGTIVAILFLTRLYLRFRNGAPALPTNMSNWQIKLAQVAHLLLYILIGFLILSGLVTAANATNPILLFGAVDITIGQTTTDNFEFLRGFHEFATNAVIALIAIHFLAAMYHLLIAKDQTTQRMLKFWKRFTTPL